MIGPCLLTPPLIHVSQVGVDCDNSVGVVKHSPTCMFAGNENVKRASCNPFFYDSRSDSPRARDPLQLERAFLRSHSLIVVNSAG